MVPSIEQEIRDLHALFGSPRDPEARAFVPLADAYRRSGDPSRALEVLDEGLERHPELAAGYLVAGLTRRDLADDGGAEAAFRRVLELDGDNARALVGLGRLLRARGEDGEGNALVARAVALDPGLGREVAPDRVPRHSGNPEVVDSGEPGGLAPLEWEVVPEPDGVDEAAGEGPDADDAVLDVAALSPEEGGGSDVSEVEPAAELEPDGLREGDPRDFLVSADAEAALLDAVAGSGPAGEGAWSGGDLDIDWELDETVETAGSGEVDDDAGASEPVEAVDAVATSGPEAEAPPVGEDDLVLDPADLAPDDWTPDESMFGALAHRVEPEPEGSAPPGVEEPEASDAASVVEAPAAGIASPGEELLMELADLAPDIEPGSRRARPAGDDEALPTRTLGELYARQGLLGEAVSVFEDLVARSPGDVDLRARLDELRAERDGRTAAARAAVPQAPRDALPAESAPEPASAPASADDPPVAEFFADLLSWSPDRPDDEASDG